jgi:hypothetical protein
MSTIGKLFAFATEIEQAEFLNEAGRTFRRVCDSNSFAEMQLCRVADLLDDDGRRVVTTLAGFIESDKERHA